jgi:hypothetical protein
VVFVFTVERRELGEKKEKERKGNGSHDTVKGVTFLRFSQLQEGHKEHRHLGVIFLGLPTEAGVAGVPGNSQREVQLF